MASRLPLVALLASMRVLLVKTSSLGDVIHNLPVVSDIRRKFPHAAINWVVEESFAALPRLHPGVACVIPVAVRRWRRTFATPATWREVRAFRHALQDTRYDCVLDTQGLLKSALIARLALGRRCGYASEAAREPLAARCYDATFVIPKNLHAVERNRWLAAAALGYEPDLRLDYGIAAPPLLAEWLPQQPYAMLLTASSRDDKLWPEPHWLKLAEQLNARGLVCVLPGGSDVERSRAARLAAAMKSGIAAPPLALDALASLLAGAHLVVGVDTGLTHLAAALSKPTVALFTGSDPKLTGVYNGARAINIGAAGTPPGPPQVIDAIAALPA